MGDKEKLEEAAETVEQQAPEVSPGPPLDGILIRVEYTDEGDARLDLQTLGSTRLTEVATLLGSALKLHKEQLGL